MKQALVTFMVLVAYVVTPSVSAADTAPTIEAADKLVDLVKPHESEAQAIRFMITVAPMEMPAGLADCTVKEAMLSMRSYFASQFSENMSKAEIDRAIEFFQSPGGQAVVALRLEHEQSLFDTALSKAQIVDEQLHYPAPLQKELEAFGSTPAGKFFIGDELLAREAIRTQISDLRSEAMTKCLATSK